MSDFGARSTVRADCFLLADAVQEANGKLFVLGGGWDRLVLSGPETKAPPMALACRIIVPWLDTNRLLRFLIHLQDSDGNELLGNINIDINVGRPPQLDPGADQAIPLAINLTDLVFQRQGTYAFKITHDDQDLARKIFMVAFSQDVQARPPSAPFAS